jgi:UDP-N-acetylmuramate: L-alanyl-gamma-D-glutamyl-meso-diaminopimelate ligase
MVYSIQTNLKESRLKLHILGICGTFMAGVAKLASELGHRVTGSDANVYPPMSTLLASLGIDVFEGYSESHLEPKPDCVIVGNAIKRTNPELEAMLNQKIPYTSGPAWLFEHVLKDRDVIAVSGTHGKTTVTSMLAWILDFAGLNPGFLIGGVAENFNASARLGESPFFVIEADEYDTALFDKRSKFLHYHPDKLIINNLEFDHADIFKDLDAIKTQFHHLIRTMPSSASIITNAAEPNIDAVLAQGCWTPVTSFNTPEGYHVSAHNADWSAFSVKQGDVVLAEIHSNTLGLHNALNTLAAMITANLAGVSFELAANAMAEFKNVKRRLELKGDYHGIKVYDDFAHHPTAIAKTLKALHEHINGARLIVVLELGSYTMRTGVHDPARFDEALSLADLVYLKGDPAVTSTFHHAHSFDNTDQLIETLVKSSQSGDHILVMSNTGFDGFFDKLKAALGATHVSSN